MNPQEFYDVQLTPSETVKVISDLAAGLLATGHFDPRSDSELIEVVCRAEKLFNWISGDVAQTLNERTDFFKLPCD